LIKPSAGLPGSVVEKPETFEAAVPGLLNLGVRLIGGCCGSTEAHISALRRGLDRVPGKTVFLESH
jgi:5-methyltetrahydrofolate--homocysteine methyltransferase